MQAPLLYRLLQDLRLSHLEFYRISGFYFSVFILLKKGYVRLQTQAFQAWKSFVSKIHAKISEFSVPCADKIRLNVFCKSMTHKTTDNLYDPTAEKTTTNKQIPSIQRVFHS